MSISCVSAALSLAALATSCVTVQYDRKLVELPRSPDAIGALVPMKSSLADALSVLGAPLEVWELADEAMALAYGSSESCAWVWRVSVPVFENASARISYDDTALSVEGYVLFFDAEHQLTLVRSGLLKDLARDVQRVRPSLPDA